MSAARRSITTSSTPTTSGTLSWEEVECLGACVNAPMVMIFKDTYEDLTPERLGRDHRRVRRRQGRRGPARPAERPHLLGAAVRPDVAERREGDPEVDARQGSRGCRQARPSRRRQARRFRRRRRPSRRPMRRRPTRALKSPSPVKGQPDGREGGQRQRRRIRRRGRQQGRAGGREGRRSSASADRASRAGRAFKSPELLRGEPIGAAGKKPAKPPSPRSTTRTVRPASKSRQPSTISS